MPPRNLKIRAGSCKGGLLFLLTAALMFGSCSSNDNGPLADTLPGNFTLQGTYYLTQRAYTRDGINYEYEYPSTTAGVMKFEASDSVLSATYELPAYPFERDYTLQSMELADSGYVVLDGKTVWLYATGLTDFQKGYYSEDDDWFEVNYTDDKYLYTERWQRVKEATEIKIDQDGLPYVP